MNSGELRHVVVVPSSLKLRERRAPLAEAYSFRLLSPSRETATTRSSMNVVMFIIEYKLLYTVIT